MVKEKLTKLSVQGFRSLRNVDLKLGDLTVLVGANGSGKSNLVAFFNLMSYVLSGNLQLYIARKGGAGSILHYGQKQTPAMVAELAFEGEKGRSEYGFTMSFAEPDRLIFEEERLRFHTNGKPEPYVKHYSIGQLESVLPGLAEGPGEQTQAKVARVFLKRLKGLQAYHFHDTSETAYIRTKQDIERNRALLTSGGNLAAFLHMLQASYPQHYQRIQSTVRLAVPYLKEFELAPDAINARSIQLRWRDRNPDYEFGPHQLSDGSLRAIALITALMQPEELLPAVVVIDEPELGLHPTAVGLIASLIKSASEKRQVVVATQSPRLLAGFTPEDVVVVDREEEGSGLGYSTYKRLSAKDLGDWMQGYDLGSLYEMNVTGGGPA